MNEKSIISNQAENYQAHIQYLRVPYAEKDEAKKLGAKWDKQKKLWFIPEETDEKLFEKWIPKKVNSNNIDFNILSKGFYIVKSEEECWKCHRLTDVFGIILPENHQTRESSYKDSEDLWQGWIKSKQKKLISSIHLLNKNALRAIKEISSNYYYDFSKFTFDYYYVNHCEHCDSIQEDFHLFSERGGAFFPFFAVEGEKMTLYWFQEYFAGFAGIYSTEVRFFDSIKTRVFSRGDEIYCEYGISFERIAWDNYVFTSYILKTKFRGQLYTRKANESIVSEDQIFREHLKDFKTTIYYCFFRHFPYIEYLLSVEFEILTDRTKGWVYLIKLHCVYHKNFFKDYYSDSEIEDIKKIQNSIFSIIEEFNIESPYLNLGNCMDKDGFQIFFSNEITGI
jgi:hypothetical protein